MNTTAQITEVLRTALEHPSRGVVGLVDDLLRLCPEQGLRLDGQADRCRISFLTGDSEEATDVPLRQSVFRAILARIAVLCNERTPDSVSPYGGQGELSAGANPPAVFRVSFANTPAVHKLELTTEAVPVEGDRAHEEGPIPMTAKQGKPAIVSAEERELEKFVVHNEDLLALESRIGRFNIFDALGIARVEIRHSNFLAFILDPAESHGQGQLFLKAILMDLLKTAPAGSRPLSPIELDGTDLRGVEVRREWEHIDILITCQQPPFVVAIENKVDAHEHSDQLRRYKEKVRQHHSEDGLLVYLTPPDARDPTDSDWMPYSYADLFCVLTRVLATYRKAIGEDVLVFVDHYLSLIGTRFMNDDKIDELCRRIYTNHRQALELIIERGRPASGVLAEAATVLQEDTRWHVFYQTSKEIFFVPKAWLEWLPELGLDRKGDRRSWIVLCLQLSDERWLGFLVQVRRMEDVTKRREIVEKLIAEGQKFGFKYNKKGQKVTDFYTAVSGRERIIKWAEDNEPDSDTIRAAVKEKLDDIYPKLAGIPPLLEPLLSLTEPAK